MTMKSVLSYTMIFQEFNFVRLNGVLVIKFKITNEAYSVLTEAVARMYSVKTVYLKISQNS